jgi:hypothetical protein
MVIVWGACVANYDRAARWLLPGLDLNAAPDDEVILVQDTSIARAYNRIVDVVSDEVTLVLLHDDVELGEGARDAIVAAVKSASVVGAIGSSGATSLAWWEAPVKRGAVGETRGPIVFDEPGPVDTVDGLLLAFAPGHGLRFDEDYPGFHGYDADICAQARSRGLTVEVASIPLYHHTKGGYGNEDTWAAANARWQQKWRT